MAIMVAVMFYIQLLVCSHVGGEVTQVEQQILEAKAENFLSADTLRDTSSYLNTWRGFPQMSKTEIGRDIRYVQFVYLLWIIASLSLEIAARCSDV